MSSQSLGLPALSPQTSGLVPPCSKYSQMPVAGPLPNIGGFSIPRVLSTSLLMIKPLTKRNTTFSGPQSLILSSHRSGGCTLSRKLSSSLRLVWMWLSHVLASETSELPALSSKLAVYLGRVCCSPQPSGLTQGMSCLPPLVCLLRLARKLGEITHEPQLQQAPPCTPSRLLAIPKCGQSVTVLIETLIPQSPFTLSVCKATLATTVVELGDNLMRRR